ncbi:hypothetical protein ACFYOV_06435 [Streptomyces sp. NPDC005931]|uniref:hypothetical protein n=1 Tax=Streptomyces sp. NPDC005931 TaxID=3364737 RepID=UPI0036C23F97
MTRPPAATRVLFASALSVTALLTSAACSAESPEGARAASASSSASAPSASATATGQAPPAASALTQAQVRAALITETDLGEPWMPSRGAATWRDGLLKATTENTDCRRLLDALYTEELFGTPTGPGAAVTLDDAYNDTQMRYQVAPHRPEDVDRTLSWLTTLPEKCGHFEATTTGAGVQGVEVDELPLPEAGDARAALRVTVAGETGDGEQTYLTVDLAAVRVGEDTITLTNGGFGQVLHEITRAVAHLGAERLAEVRRQVRVEV